MSHRPWVNYALVAANVGIFLLGFRGDIPNYRAVIGPYLLDNVNPQLYQFFSSMFLHGGWSHLIGNMVFLWVFGNAINDRFGHVGYAAFYLAGGVMAGVGYQLASPDAPALGASGAISAVTGAYLVLLPRARVTLLMFFYFITTFEVSSWFFLLFQVLFNMFMTASDMAGPGGGGVAYSAHAAGYLFGIIMGIGVLALGLIPRDEYDVLHQLQSWRRRSKYRRLISQGYDPFKAGAISRNKTTGKRNTSRKFQKTPPPAPDSSQVRLRDEIFQLWRKHDLGSAASKYLQLIRLVDGAVLPREQQRDIANQLMADGQYPPAADAYERFLITYDDDEQVAEFYLMLGLLYGRYLGQSEQAEKYLTLAINSHVDDRKRDLARDDLANLKRRKDG